MTMLLTYSMDEIEREFLFVRADVEELERALERISQALAAATRSAPTVLGELQGARTMAADLAAKISSVETRLTTQVRQREAV